MLQALNGVVGQYIIGFLIVDKADCDGRDEYAKKGKRPYFFGDSDPRFHRN
jgi:hypothetical protein